MLYDDQSIDEVEGLLRKVLGVKLQELLDLLKSDPDLYLIQIPNSDAVDLGLEELASLVARTSNAYGRITRLCGMARAEAKLAKGSYERSFKAARSDGKNSAEREANAINASRDEHIALNIAEAVASMLDSLEDGARVASESARKIYDKVSNMYVAQGRESTGQMREGDFKTVSRGDFRRWD